MIYVKFDLHISHKRTVQTVIAKHFAQLSWRVHFHIVGAEVYSFRDCIVSWNSVSRESDTWGIVIHEERK